MSTINPATLARLRKKKGWSLDQLAERAKVNRSTIHRIEQGKPVRGHRDQTIANLAKTLNCPSEELTSPPDEAETDSLGLPARRSRSPWKMSDAAQNALAFVAERYGVQPEIVLDFAPLLFDLTAIESLLQRRARLTALREQSAKLGATMRDFPHLSDELGGRWDDADEIDGIEDESIRRWDVLGYLIEPRAADENYSNPFMAFLKVRSEEIASRSAWRATIEECLALSPEYEVCGDVALSHAEGDEDIAHGLNNGLVKLSDMPPSLRASGESSERAAWLREQIGKRRAEFELYLFGLDETGKAPDAGEDR